MIIKTYNYEMVKVDKIEFTIDGRLLFFSDGEWKTLPVTEVYAIFNE